MTTSSFATVRTVVLLLLLSISTVTRTDGYNITTILAKHPEFSTYNHYLTVTHLASEINRRLTVTCLVVDNAGMSTLLSKHLSVFALRNVLSLHVLVDYFGSVKIHKLTGRSQLVSTMFQASGQASGTSGFVNVTNLHGGKVAFGTEDGHLTSHFVKSVLEMPYKISVLQISQIIISADAEAPAEAPNLNVTFSLQKEGCMAFADLLVSSGAMKAFEENVDGGLTVFCPSDKSVAAFAPKYKNLTAANKVSLLLYHAIPIYQTLQSLKSNNGLMNTLATDGASKYELTVQNVGEIVNIDTTVVTATVTGTLKDQEPLVAYKIDKVLLPTELGFKSATTAPKKAASPSSDDDSADAPDTTDDGTADDKNAAAAAATVITIFNMVVLLSCISIGMGLFW